MFRIFSYFYLQEDKFTFTNEVKHGDDTNNAKSAFIKSYRYPQIHKQEFNTKISKCLINVS